MQKTLNTYIKNLENIIKSKRLKIIKKDLIDLKSLKKFSINTDILIHEYLNIRRYAYINIIIYQ